MQPKYRINLRGRIAAAALAISMGACATVPSPPRVSVEGEAVHTDSHVDPYHAANALYFVGAILETVFWIHAIRHGGHFHGRRH